MLKSYKPYYRTIKNNNQSQSKIIASGNSLNNIVSLTFTGTSIYDIIYIKLYSKAEGTSNITINLNNIQESGSYSWMNSKNNSSDGNASGGELFGANLDNCDIFVNIEVYKTGKYKYRWDSQNNTDIYQGSGKLLLDTTSVHTISLSGLSGLNNVTYEVIGVTYAV